MERLQMAAILLLVAGLAFALFPNLSRYLPLTGEQSWVVHGVFFFAASYLGSRIIGVKRTVALLLLLGIMIEVLQNFVPGRRGSIDDFLADVVAIALFLALRKLGLFDKTLK